MTLNINDIRRQTIWVCKTCIKVNMKQYKAGVGSEESMQSCCRRRKKKKFIEIKCHRCLHTLISYCCCCCCFSLLSSIYNWLRKRSTQNKTKTKKTKNLWTRFWRSESVYIPVHIKALHVYISSINGGIITFLCPPNTWPLQVRQ